MRATFHHRERQRELERDGFTVVPLLSAEEVAACSALYRDLAPPAEAKGFHASLFSTDPAYKAGADRGLRALVAARAAEWVAEHQPLVANFVVKQPGERSEMTPHQDWTFVDERRFASLNVWCPLVDTGAHNGSLHVLPGAHRLPFTIRGTGLRSPTLGLRWQYGELRDLPLRAGQAVIYDHRVIHGSPPNRSDEVRLALAMILVPAETEARHYRRDPASGRVVAWEIDATFFHRFTYGDPELPPGLRRLDEIDFEDRALTADDLAPLLRPPPRRRSLLGGWWARGRA